MNKYMVRSINVSQIIKGLFILWFYYCLLLLYQLLASHRDRV